MINYIMSWYCTENIPRLIERPWWKFWGHDTLVLEQKEVRKVIGMTAAEGRAFERFWNQNPDCLSVFGKLMGNNTKMVQLEIGNLATPYIPSSYVSYMPEQCVTNELRDSLSKVKT